MRAAHHPGHSPTSSPRLGPNTPKIVDMPWKKNRRPTTMRKSDSTGPWRRSRFRSIRSPRTNELGGDLTVAGSAAPAARHHRAESDVFLIDVAAGPKSSIRPLITVDAVEHRVGPSVRADDLAGKDLLTGEPGVLQRPLFGHVGQVGVGLDPVQLGVGEEVIDQQPLGHRAMPTAPGLGKERDADVPA